MARKSHKKQQEEFIALLLKEVSSLNHKLALSEDRVEQITIREMRGLFVEISEMQGDKMNGEMWLRADGVRSLAQYGITLPEKALKTYRV